MYAFFSLSTLVTLLVTKFQLMMISMLLMLFVSCKTTEEVRREKVVDEMSNKFSKSEEMISESHRIMASHSKKFIELESLMNKNSGAIEELKYQQTLLERKNNERLSSMEKKLSEALSLVDEQRIGLQDQKKYLEELLASLSKLQNSLEGGKKKLLKIPKEKKSEKTEKSDPKVPGTKNDALSQAIGHFERKEYRKSREKLLALIDSGVTGDAEVRPLYYLGLSEYRLGHPDQALVYFGKLYTNHAGSSFSDKALYYIGKSLLSLDKRDEAAESFETLIKKYPDSPMRENAQKALDEM
ncbi:MAG: tetratricopeptide repeat protein [Oligoflexia bacterium]|nr:tetratricopeptide repeat protein [Oligoflexia bacterium]